MSNWNLKNDSGPSRISTSAINIYNVFILFTEKEISLTVKTEDYIKKLNAEGTFQFFASFTVKGTKQHFVSIDCLALEKPCLTITVSN